LLYLTEFWQDIPEAELQSFVLASYNAGPGHVEDARRLAEKFGKDPDLWQDVSEYLLLKAKPEYYQDEVVKYGYCRGREPVAYVKEILERYGNYAKVIPV
jgi:membrane-bound lytic murein transglycosylase F